MTAPIHALSPLDLSTFVVLAAGLVGRRSDNQGARP